MGNNVAHGPDAFPEVLSRSSVGDLVSRFRTIELPVQQKLVKLPAPAPNSDEAQDYPNVKVLEVMVMLIR